MTDEDKDPPDGSMSILAYAVCVVFINWLLFKGYGFNYITKTVLFGQVSGGTLTQIISFVKNRFFKSTSNQ